VITSTITPELYDMKSYCQLIVSVTKCEKVNGKGKVKSLYLTSVVPSVTRLVSMEADGAPFTPLPLSLLHFTVEKRQSKSKENV